MSDLPRVRHHTDGRHASRIQNGGYYRWSCWGIGADGFLQDSLQPEDGVHGPGWSELFVAELPEPDGWINTVGDNREDTKMPYWNTTAGQFTAWTEGVEDDGGLVEDLNVISVDALKKLAAVAACERYRTERTTP